MYIICVCFKIYIDIIFFSRDYFCLYLNFGYIFNNYYDVNYLFYRRNEEVDEKVLIKKLRKRVVELESELLCLLMVKVM